MFNPALLEIDHPVDVDIHQFNRANSLPAGNYKVSIYVNGEYVDRREVTFVEDTATSNLHPCFSDIKTVLAELGVKVAAIKALNDMMTKPVWTPRRSFLAQPGRLIRINSSLTSRCRKSILMYRRAAISIPHAGMRASMR
nr:MULTISPECIES: FimD/PapC N-terminal domain-containing protein [Enterobacter cloacae complex]